MAAPPTQQWRLRGKGQRHFRRSSDKRCGHEAPTKRLLDAAELGWAYLEKCDPPEKFCYSSSHQTSGGNSLPRHLPGGNSLGMKPLKPVGCYQKAAGKNMKPPAIWFTRFLVVNSPSKPAGPQSPWHSSCFGSKTEGKFSTSVRVLERKDICPNLGSQFSMDQWIDLNNLRVSMGFPQSFEVCPHPIYRERHGKLLQPQETHLHLPIKWMDFLIDIEPSQVDK